MTEKWDPRSKIPDGSEGFVKWFADDLERFRRSRLDLPQGVLGARARNKVVRAWNEAREAAELKDAANVGSEFYQVVKRFQKTRTISLSPGKSKKKSACK